MAETQNISKMAEILAESAFKELKWTRNGPANHNFSCVNEDHNKKTHPADVVFWYQHPYTGNRVYLVVDLKSYARGSITAESVRGSISSLALSIDCAKVSEDFRRVYISGASSAEYVGVLFIFNHDKGFDTEFPGFLQKMYEEYPSIPSGVKVCVLGPQDIWYLNNVANDMKILRGDGVLPSAEDCTFLYPDLSRAKVAQEDWNQAATIESIKAPWQIIKYRKNGSLHLLVYYRNTGDTVQEFVYLIDKMVHYQWVALCSSITVRAPNASPNASATFSLAVKEYSEPSITSKENNEKLGKIRFENMQHVTPNFSEIQIGMEPR